MRSRALLWFPVVVLFVGVVLVAVAQIRLAQIASIYTLEPGEQIITQVAHPIAPWPAVASSGVAIAVVGLLGLVALIAARSTGARRPSH